ncbi:hypothetical protein ACYBSK_23255 [Streptomyces sp. BYX5S]
MQALGLTWSAPASRPAHGGSGVGALLVARRHIDLCRHMSACCRR